MAAQQLIRRQPVLMILPPSGQTGYEALCSQAMYRTLVQSQQFQILPDWYVYRELGPPEPWQKDWPGLFQRLPEAEQALLLQLNDRAEGPELVTLLLQRGTPPGVCGQKCGCWTPGEPNENVSRWRGSSWGWLNLPPFATRPSRPPCH